MEGLLLWSPCLTDRASTKHWSETEWLGFTQNTATVLWSAQGGESLSMQQDHRRLGCGPYPMLFHRGSSEDSRLVYQALWIEGGA